MKKIYITAVAAVNDNTAKAVLHEVVAWRDRVYKIGKWIVGVTQSDRIIAVNNTDLMVGIGGGMILSENFWADTLTPLRLRKEDFSDNVTVNLTLTTEHMLWYNGIEADADEICHGEEDILAKTGVPGATPATQYEVLEQLFQDCSIDEPRWLLEDIWRVVKYLPIKKGLLEAIALWRARKLASIEAKAEWLELHSVYIIKPTARQPRKPRLRREAEEPKPRRKQKAD